MPCYTVRKTSVEFKADHVASLEKALTQLGWSYNLQGQRVSVYPKGGATITLNLADGKATIEVGQNDKLNELKRAYSMEQVKRAGLAKRWQTTVTKKTATGAKGKYIRQYV